jgi:hypothetical protein
MTILECMTDAYLLATGKPTLPAQGSTKYNRLYALAKRLHRRWQVEPDVDWNSLYAIVGAGTVTETDTFDLDTDIHKISQRPGDYVYISKNGANYLYKLVDASELGRYRYAVCVALIGQTLKFSRPFTATDQVFGGTINVPAYVKLNEIESIDDDVLVDDPDWLAAAVAQYYVMPDSEMNYMLPDLQDQANELMTSMIQANYRDDSYQSDEDYLAAAIGGQ